MGWEDIRGRRHEVRSMKRRMIFPIIMIGVVCFAFPIRAWSQSIPDEEEAHRILWGLHLKSIDEYQERLRREIAEDIIFREHFQSLQNKQ